MSDQGSHALWAEGAAATAVNACSHSLWLLASDCVVEANHAACELLGCELTALRGQLLSDSQPPSEREEMGPRG